MAINNLDNFFKSAKVVKRGAKSSDPGWLANALKSIGYSAEDSISKIMPATMGTIKSVSENSKDIIDQLRQSRSQLARLTRGFNQNAYIGMGKDIFKNSLEDLKSGKFYNKDRHSGGEGSGDSDISFDVPDFNVDSMFDDSDFEVNITSGDGSTSIGLDRTNENGVESTITNISTKISDDSPMVAAVGQQTKISTMNASMVVDIMKRQHVLTSQSMNNIYNGLMSGFATLNDNVSQFTPVISKALDGHMQLSAKYYNDSIAALNEIRDAIVKSSQPVDPNEPAKKKDNSKYKDASDLFDYETGAINFEDYKEYVKDRFKQTIENADNMILSTAKFIYDQRDLLMSSDLKDHPIKFLTDAIVERVIPAAVKKAASEFDEQFKETTKAILYGVGSYANDDNPIKSLIGQTFGISNKLSTTLDKSNYTKGPVAWTGKSDRTLNDVIPTYLRKILSALTSSEEVVFDYNTGKWTSLDRIKSKFNEDRDLVSLGGLNYSDFFSEWKSFLGNFQFAGDRQYGDAIQYAENFVRNLIKTNKLMGPDEESLKQLTGSDDTDPLLHMLRGFLNSRDNSFVTKLFSSNQLDARRYITDWYNRINNDPSTNNFQYIDTGLRDNQMFLTDPDTGRIVYINNDYITGNSNSNSRVSHSPKGLSMGLRDEYGRSSVYYTRQILEVLLNGVNVRIVSGNSSPTNNQNNNGQNPTDPISRISSNLQRDKDIFAEQRRLIIEDLQDNPIPNSEERAQRFGLRHIDLETDTTMNAAEAERIAREQRELENAPPIYLPGEEPMTWREVFGITDDTPMGRMLNKFNDYVQRPITLAADLFKRADNFLFELVFGQRGNQMTSGSLLNRGVESIADTVKSFGTWMHGSVILPLNEAFFGDDGFVTKLKDSTFGNDMKNYLTKAKEFVFGKPDENGINQGGLLSGVANEVKDAGRYLRHAITGKGYVDQYGNEYPDNEDSIVGKIKAELNKGTTFIKKNVFGMDDEDLENTQNKNTLVSAMNSVWLGIKHRAETFGEDVFGKEGTDKRKAFEQFKYDMKGNGAKIATGALLGTVGAGLISGIGGLGLAGSILLSPLGGAAIGMTAAIASKSSQLQRLLFGEIDEDGKRTGGLITKGMQDFIKKGLPGIVGGAGVGVALKSIGVIPELGLLGSMMFPGGPVLTSALIGGASYLGIKATNFGKAIFGDNDGSKESFADSFKRIFSKENMKKYVGDTVVGGMLGKMAFGSLASAGLLPSFFLPGGPIVGALFGLSTSIVSNSDKFRTFMFGEKDEETGERSGGIVGAVKDKLSDVGTSISTMFQIYQEKIVHFARKNIMIPLQATVDPFINQIKEVTTGIKDKIVGIYDSTIGFIKDSVVQYIINPIAEATKPIRDSLKKAGSFIFKAFTKILTGVITLPARIGAAAIAAPFQLAGRIFGIDSYTLTKRRARKAFREETLDAATGLRDRYGQYRRQYGGGNEGVDDKTVRKGLLKDFVAGRGDSAELRKQNQTRTLFGIRDDRTGELIKQQVNDDGTTTGGFKEGLLYKFLFDNAYWKAGTEKETYHRYNKKDGGFYDREIGADYDDPRKTMKRLRAEENQRYKDEIARIKGRPGTKKWAKNIHDQAVTAWKSMSDYERENVGMSEEDFIAQTEERLKSGENNQYWWRADTTAERAEKDNQRLREMEERTQNTINTELPDIREIAQGILDSINNNSEQLPDRNSMPSISMSDIPNGMDSLNLSDRPARTTTNAMPTAIIPHHNIVDALQPARTNTSNSTLPTINSPDNAAVESLQTARINTTNNITLPVIGRPTDSQIRSAFGEKIASQLGLIDIGSNTTPSSAQPNHRPDRQSVSSDLMDELTRMYGASVVNNPGRISMRDVELPPLPEDMLLPNVDESTPTHADGAVIGRTQLAILSRGERVLPNPNRVEREEGRKSEQSFKEKLISGKDAFVSSITKLGEFAKTMNDSVQVEKSQSDFSIKKFASFVTSELINDPIGFIADIVKAPFELIENTINKIGEKAYEHIISPVIEVVKQPFVAVKNAIEETIDETVNTVIAPFKKISDTVTSAVDTTMYAMLHPVKTIEAGIDAFGNAFGKKGDAISKTTQKELNDTTEYGNDVDSIVKADQITFKDQTEFNDERKAKEESMAKIKAGQDAGSYTTLIEGIKSREQQEAANDKLSLIAANTANSAEIAKQHSITWDSIFSKKGLITGGLIAAIPLAISLFNKLKNGGLLGGISELIGNALSGISQALEWLLKNWKKDNGETEDMNGDGEIDDAERIIQDALYGFNSVGGLSGVANNIGEGVGNLADLGAGLLDREGFSAIDQYVAPDGEWTGSSDAKAKVFARGATTVVKTGAKVVKKATTKIASGDGLISAILKLGSQAITFAKDFFGKKIASMATKVGTKAGQKTAFKAVTEILEKISKSLLKPNIITKFSSKFGKVLGKVASAVGTGGLIEIGFAAAGAINGAYSAANLFQISSDRVDGKMRLISSMLEALLMTTPGTIIDVLDTIGMEVLGFSFMSEIAVSIYNAFSTDEEDAALLASRANFKDEYEAALDAEYQQYLEENGLTEEEYSKDDYRASSEATTFSDYNAQQNQTLGSKMWNGMKKAGSAIKTGATAIWDGVKTVGSGIKNAVNWYTDSKSTGARVVRALGALSNPMEAMRQAYHIFAKDKEVGWYDSETGSYFVCSADGNSFDEYTASGDKIAEGIDYDIIMNRIKSGDLTKASIGVKGDTRVKIEQFIDDKKQAISEGFGKLVAKGVELKSRISQTWSDMTNGFNAIKQSAFNYFNGRTESGWYDPSDGTYYVLDGGWKQYSAAGNLIAENIDANTVYQMIKTGNLVESEVNINSGIAQSALGKFVTGIKDHFVNLGKTTELAWNTIKSTVSATIKTFIDGFKENKILKKIGKIATLGKKEAWFDSNGNYYIMNSNGSYSFYNSNGGLISDDVDGETVEEYKRMGLLTVGTIDEKPAIKDYLTAIKDVTKSVWESATNAAKQAWNAIKDAFTTGYGNLKKSSSDIKKAIAEENKSTIDEAITGSGGFGTGITRPKLTMGGFGGDDAIGSNSTIHTASTMTERRGNFIDNLKGTSGTASMSQKDSSVSNIPFNNPNDTIKQTIGDSGCGPVVAANVINNITGKDTISVQDAANYAIDNGFKAKDGGTAPGYFNSIMSEYGLSASPTHNVQMQLKSGKPVIMLGDTDKPSHNTPFGSVPHYVVAMGMDDDGKVIIQDPLKQSGYQKYKFSDLGNIYSTMSVDYGSGNSDIIRRKVRLGDVGIDVTSDKYGKGGTLTAAECAVQDLRVFYPLTAQDIEDVIKAKNSSCYWAGYGYAFIQASIVSGMDPRFIFSLVVNEAGWNPGNRHTSIHNYYSINMPDTDLDHGTHLGKDRVEGIINGALWIAKNYVHNSKRNQYTIRKMRLGENESGNHCYNTRQYWEDMVARIMAYFPKTSNYDTNNLFDTGKTTSFTGSSEWAGSYSSSTPDGSANAFAAGTTNTGTTTSSGIGRSISSALMSFANAASKPILDFLLGEEKVVATSASSGIDTSIEDTIEETSSSTKYNNAPDGVKNNLSTTVGDYFKTTIGKETVKYNSVHHPGADYTGDGWVYSPVDGDVVAKGYSKLLGQYVTIQDNQGKYHKFGSLLRPVIGDKKVVVAEKTALGKTGNSIDSEKPFSKNHLHYEYSDSKSSTGNTKDPNTVKRHEINQYDPSSIYKFDGNTTTYDASGKLLTSGPGFGGDVLDEETRDTIKKLEDFTYYSQNDPRYANEPYMLSDSAYGEADSSQTIAARGCGPTSLAMVATQLTGKEIDPVTLADIATANNYSTSVGTTPEYFTDIGRGLGLNVSQQLSTKDNLINSLKANNPVILQGKNNDPNSPYTRLGHYVVATGIKNGNIMINDPRGRSTSGEYKLSDVLKGSGAMWSFDASRNSTNPMDMNGEYPDNLGGGQTYPDIVNGHIYYNQTDERWGQKVYAGGAKFKDSGCVVTAIAQTASDVLGTRIEPPEAAETMRGNSGFSGANIVWDNAMQAMKNKYGVQYEIISGPARGGGKSASDVVAYVKDKLGRNIPLVMYGAYHRKPGVGQHALGAIGLTSNNGVILNDVGSYYDVTSKMPDGAWDLNQMAKYAKTLIAMTDSNGGGSKGTNLTGTISSGGATTGTETTSIGSRSITGALMDFANAASKPILDFLLGEEPVESTSSSSNGAISSSTNTQLSGSSNKSKIWNYFKGKNYSDNLTAGIMGNMERESGYDWTITGDSSPYRVYHSTQVPYNKGGYGLIQWTNPQSQRIANNQALAESSNKYGLNSLEGQLSVVSGTLEQRPVYTASGGLTEGTNGSAYNIYKFKQKYGDDYLTKINNMSVHDATKAFHDCVEISADSNMNKRYNFADGVIKEFGGKTEITGLGGFGDGAKPSRARYRKSNINSTTRQINKYRLSNRNRMRADINRYTIGGFGETPQQITINSSNPEVVSILSSMLTELKSTNTGINRFNDKELSVTTNTNAPVINNTTNNIVNSNQTKQNNKSIDPSMTKFDTSKYKMAKQIASGRIC